MLTTEPFFRSLIDKPVAQAKEANELVICLSCDSREEVDTLIAKAVAAGGRTPHPPEDHGGVGSAATALVLATGAGPFLVTAPNTAVSVARGSQLNVTWNVANTAASPVNTANVKISLSTDGGLTFPYVLAASTPNNGSKAVTLPALSTTAARIKVEAVGNVFFDVSNANFTIN